MNCFICEKSIIVGRIYGEVHDNGYTLPYCGHHSGVDVKIALEKRS